MTFRPFLLLSCSFAALASTPASAHDSSPEALRAEIEALKAQLRDVEARLNAANAAAPVPAAPVPPATAAATPAAKPETEIVWKGAPQLIREDGWSFKPRGRLMYDAAYVSSPPGIDEPGLEFANELRRARLGVEGSIPGGFGYKFEIDVADNDIAVTDAILTYETGRLGLAIGQHNNFQSLEELTSSRFTTFIERAAFTDAFNFERRIGASVEYGGEDMLFQAGVFTDDIDALTADENDSHSVDARAVYLPKVGDTQLHLGGSVHLRDLGDVPGARYRQRPFVHTTDVRFIGTPNLPVTKEFSYGFEAAVIPGPIHFAGEVHWLNSDLVAGRRDPTFFGGYAEAGWFITGERRGYKGGEFDRTKPLRPLGDGGWGALQFNLRYDHLDLTDAGIIGGTQNGYLASIIWTPVAYVRFGAHYGHLEYDDATIVAAGRRDYSVDALGVRAEVDF